MRVCVCVCVCVCERERESVYAGHVHAGCVMRQCSSIGAVVLVVSNMHDACCSCLSLSAFSCCHRIALVFQVRKEEPNV